MSGTEFFGFLALALFRAGLVFTTERVTGLEVRSKQLAQEAEEPHPIEVHQRIMKGMAPDVHQ